MKILLNGFLGLILMSLAYGASAINSTGNIDANCAGTTTNTLPNGTVITTDCNGSGNAGCASSSAVAGTFLEPKLDVLRTFRDTTLAPHASGQRFISWYYEKSPSMSAAFEQHQWLKGIAIGGIGTAIFSLEHPALALGIIALVMGSLVYRRKSS